VAVAAAVRDSSQGSLSGTDPTGLSTGTRRSSSKDLDYIPHSARRSETQLMFLVDRASMYYYHEETDHRLLSMNFLLGFPSIELPACRGRTADDYLSYMQRP
jgi:hypothetical protein